MDPPQALRQGRSASEHVVVLLVGAGGGRVHGDGGAPRARHPGAEAQPQPAGAASQAMYAMQPDLSLSLSTSSPFSQLDCSTLYSEP